MCFSGAETKQALGNLFLIACKSSSYFDCFDFSRFLLDLDATSFAQSAKRL
jgi:hypothetical protein